MCHSSDSYAFGWVAMLGVGGEWWSWPVGVSDLLLLFFHSPQAHYFGYSTSNIT